MTQPKSSLLARAVILFILLSSIFVAWNIVSQRSNPPAELTGVLRAMPVPLRPFVLVDQHDTLVNEQIFKNKWSFVFFGYTSCPDICPTTLNVLNAVFDRLGETGGDLPDAQVVFISVDPERDTTEKLADYMAFFNKDFIGVSGDRRNIDIVAQQFGAGYALEKETAPGQYQVGHTSAIFLVDPDANLLAAFSQPHIPETIVSQYQGIRAYSSK